MLHLKGEEKTWKKSPYFGSVKGDETNHTKRGLFYGKFTRVRHELQSPNESEF
jgi:hypothetical protein